MQTPAVLPAAQQPLVWHPSSFVFGHYEGPVLILSHTAIWSAISRGRLLRTLKILRANPICYTDRVSIIRYEGKMA